MRPEIQQFLDRVCAENFEAGIIATHSLVTLRFAGLDRYRGRLSLRNHSSSADNSAALSFSGTPSKDAVLEELMNAVS